jgi:hypothetical protein
MIQIFLTVVLQVIFTNSFTELIDICVTTNFFLRRKLRTSSSGGAQKVRKFTDFSPSTVAWLLELMRFPQAAILNFH